MRLLQHSLVGLLSCLLLFVVFTGITKPNLDIFDTGMLAIEVPEAQNGIVNAARTKVLIHFSGPVHPETLMVTNNNTNYRVYFWVGRDQAVATSLPLYKGKNTIIARVLSRAGNWVTEELSFQAAPDTLDMRNKFIVDVPLFQKVEVGGRDIFSLSFYINVTRQTDFALKGEAQLIKVNGNMLTGPPKASPMTGEIINDDFFLNITKLQVPYEELFAGVIELIEAEIESAGYEYQIETDEEMPIFNIELAGKALDADENKKADGLDGGAKISLFYGNLELPLEGKFQAYLYEKIYNMSGGFRLEIPFLDFGNNDFLSFTLFLDCSHRTIRLSGDAYLLFINDHLLTDLPKPVDFYGAIINDEFSVNFKIPNIGTKSNDNTNWIHLMNHIRISLQLLFY